WEQRKVKDVCSISTGKSNTQDRIDGGIYPLYVRSPIIEHSNKYLYDEEAVLTVGDGVGTGKVFHYVNGKYDLHQRVYRMFDFTKDITGKYFYYYFSNHFYNRVMSMTAKTSVDSVRFEMISGMDILLPSKKEQMVITSFFDSLNNLITLHQRKLDRLKQLKQGYLQQMFPRDGESVPRLRFANFHGKWEQRKLGELVDTVKSYPLSREAEVGEPTGYRYIHYGDIHKKVADLIESDKQLPIIQGGYYEFLQQGDIVVADASEDYVGIAEPSILLKQPTDKVVAGLHTIAMRPQEICSLFLYYLLHTVEFKQFGSRIGTGMKVFGITTKNLYKFPTFFPKKEEQVKIGNFFKQLDNTIVLHQSKLDRLKSLKKGYLQKMFI
ncbi:Restriction endonuclease S subunit, partial [Anaerocolumna aminovalerica]